METYPPWEIYTNLPDFFKTRKIETDHKFAGNDEFRRKFNHFEYIIVSSTDNKFHAIVIAPNSSLASKTQDFRNLINKVPRSADSQMIFITDKPFSNFIQKTIQLIKSETSTIIDNYLYHVFEIKVLEHPYVQEHIILTGDEVESMEEQYRISRTDLPRIKASEPPMIWLGAKSGDVVRINRLSENVVVTPGYRIVV